MAKRKKRAVTRRRRVGAVSGSAISTFGGIAAGAIAARLLSAKLLSKLDPKIGSAIQVAAGVFLTTQKNPMLKGVGMGMFGAGVISAGQSFNLLSGVPSKSSWLQYPDGDMSVISGDMGLNYLGNPQGSPDMNVISGISEDAMEASMNVIS